MQKIKEALTWQMVAVLIAGGVMFIAIAIWAPSDTRQWLFGANGLLWTLVTAFIRRGSAAALPAVLAIVLAAGTAGCGASMVQQHTTAIRVVAITAASAGEIISTAVAAEAHAECPDTSDDAADVACIGRLRTRWAPADATMLSVRLALLTWLEAVSLADDHTDLWPSAFAALRRVLREWNNLTRVSADFGLQLPPLPPLIEALIGGSP